MSNKIGRLAKAAHCISIRLISEAQLRQEVERQPRVEAFCQNLLARKRRPQPEVKSASYRNSLRLTLKLCQVLTNKPTMLREVCGFLKPSLTVLLMFHLLLLSAAKENLPALPLFVLQFLTQEQTVFVCSVKMFPFFYVSLFQSDQI